MEESICLNDDTETSMQCENFIKRKQQKINKDLNIDLQWIITSFFVMFMLSTWDIADVYQYFRMPMNKNMNFLANNSSSYKSFLNDFKNYNENLLIPKDGEKGKYVSLGELKADPNFNGKINILSDYYNKYEGHYYQHYFSHHNNHQFIKKESGSSTDKQYRTTTTIKALCVFKVHSQLFAELMIFFFTLIILAKLNTIDKFIKWNSRSYLSHFKRKHQKRQVLHL